MQRPSFPTTAVLALLAALTLGSCAWTQEERDFYGRGWLNPRELDRPAAYRGPRPVGEGTTDGTPSNPWTLPPSSSAAGGRQ